MSDSRDSVTGLVLLRESVDWERYRRLLMGPDMSSNTGLRHNKYTMLHKRKNTQQETKRHKVNVTTQPTTNTQHNKYTMKCNTNEQARNMKQHKQEITWHNRHTYRTHNNKSA
jgi:hypothetical protein